MQYPVRLLSMYHELAAVSVSAIIVLLERGQNLCSSQASFISYLHELQSTYHPYLWSLYISNALLIQGNIYIYVCAGMSLIKLCTKSNNANTENPVQNTKHQQWKQLHYV